ncbi:SprT-like domain-containing protein [Terrimonas sp. NA20]|uniref:SprT-like domain-containing protein n=1 Tax=Terrimonas ginsenosidimutans TaxID=2908004 RepID=A0ABS9KRG1_9BACT|nr:SprT-like domain-containing protein [Terrimonas ginsenosidimutans]MCG2614905.1 SprT-like domain-containing protein [Terrimonas ginsenosidimutans]
MQENPSYDRQFTTEQFSALQNLYDYFNKNLFGGELGNCLLNFSRKSKAMGFYSSKRWAKKSDIANEGQKADIDEISLNPDFLHVSTKEYCQTLVHEMCHLWQHHFGEPTQGYHNREFAEKMKSVGLMPSSTGHPGGKEVGKKMSDYPIVAGLFELAFEAIPQEMLLPLIALPDFEKKKAQKKKNKIKYTCPQCSANVWGKPKMVIVCGDCSEGDETIVKFIPETTEEELEESEIL